MGAESIFLQEPASAPSSNHKAKTLQEGHEQRGKDPLRVMNVAEKEWDQLDTWLAKYDKRREQTLG
jgi:hypothetical protein